MGLGGIGVWPLLLILVIVLLLFGTKKLRNMGGDVGSAIRGFKEAMSEGEKNAKDSGDSERLEKRESTSDGEATRSEQEHDRHAS